MRPVIICGWPYRSSTCWPPVNSMCQRMALSILTRLVISFKRVVVYIEHEATDLTGHSLRAGFAL